MERSVAHRRNHYVRPLPPCPSIVFNDRRHTANPLPIPHNSAHWMPWAYNTIPSLPPTTPAATSMAFYAPCPARPSILHPSPQPHLLSHSDPSLPPFSASLYSPLTPFPPIPSPTTFPSPPFPQPFTISSAVPMSTSFQYCPVQCSIVPLFHPPKGR